MIIIKFKILRHIHLYCESYFYICIFSQDGETTTEIEPEGESHTTVDSAILQEGERLRTSDEQDEATNVEALLSDPSSELTPQIRAAIKAKWQKIVGPDTEIVVSILRNFITRNSRK